MVNKIYLIICIILLSLNVLAEEFPFIPPIPDGQEVEYLGYKYSNNSGIIISTRPLTTNVWKPDVLDDGMITIESIFEFEDQKGLLGVIPTPNFIPEFNVPVQNQNITFSNTFTERTEKYFADEQEIIFQKREFNNFNKLPSTIDLSQPFAIKLTYQAPKYSKNHFNLTVSGELNAFIDPTQSSCGWISSAGIYTLNQSISSTGNCITIGSANVRLECEGYTMSGDGGTGDYGIYAYSAAVGNVTINNCNITRFGYGTYFDDAENVTFFNNTAYSNTRSGFLVRAGSNNNNFTLNTAFNNSYYGFHLQISNNNVLNSNLAKNNTGTSRAGFYVEYDSENNTLINNTAIDNYHGFYLSKDADNNNLTGNIANNSLNKGFVIQNSRSNHLFNNTALKSSIYNFELYNTTDNILQENVAYNASQSGFTIRDGSKNNTLIHNLAYNNTLYGIYINSGSNNSLIDSNLLYNSPGYGIMIGASCDSNILLNNEIYGNVQIIRDDSGNSFVNYLIYNNSFGEIRWIDNGSGSFLRDLELDDDNGLGIGQARNLFIGNNVAALNTSAFNTGLINSSANITLNELDFVSITEIKKIGEYNTNADYILENGVNCNGTSCQILSYSEENLLFNTSYFSSFTADGLREVDVSNLSLVFTNSSAYATFRFFIQNLAPYGNLFNWNFNTGESVIESTIESNLTAEEDIFVFVEHNYPATGSYIVTANGTTTNDLDSEEINVVIS